MTPLEIIEETERFLRKQGRPAKNFVGKCFYRGPNGTKCAVGYWIPDEEYRQVLESNSVYGVIACLDTSLPTYKFLRDNVSLCNKLQSLHDTCPLKKDYTFNLREFNRRIRALKREYTNV